MKLTPWPNSLTPLLSYLRIAIGGTFLSAAVAMAFVAATGSGVFMTNTPSSDTVAKYRAMRMKLKGQYGLASRSESSDKVATAEGETSESPDEAAVEAYSNRAYPAAEIPFTLTAKAQQAWAKIKNQKSKNTVGTWNLAGPSTANFPATLTFSGAPYTTSGRITALAIAPNCNNNNCTAWVGAAGGGVWRTNNALSGSGANWTFVSGSFATNAIGTLTLDAGYNGTTNKTIYAGTGEPNASGDSEAGFGIYKSTDDGTTWTQLAATIGPISTSSPGSAGAFPNNGIYTGNAFAGRSISAIVVDPTNPNHLFVGSARGIRGYSSVTGGATSNPTPPRPPYGLFESIDGGATFNFIWDGCAAPPYNGTCSTSSVRGTHDVELDPGFGTTNTTIYAADFPSGLAGSGGVWRSTDGGATWTQIKTALNAANINDRATFAVTKLGNGNTRMYVGVGNSSISAANRARFYRSDDVTTAVPVFTDMTTSQNFGYCDNGINGAQCWYDNVVYSPPGKPDVVYLGGAYSYNNYGYQTNGRAFLRSADAGASFTDMTWDATTGAPPADSYAALYPGTGIAPNGMHPDSHAIVEVPGSNVALFGSDGGLVRTSGSFANISSQCTSPRGLTGSDLALCQQLLSAVPTHLFSLNKGLSTLQFQSLSVAADDPKHLQGGTQDNGTFETTGGSVTWPQIIYGDGGQSGFSATNSSLRFNTFTGQASDVNFQNGNPTKWVIATGPIVSSPENAYFYPPIIGDSHPANAGSIYQGSMSVWRTQDWGGNQAYLETNCPEFITSAANPACGDFVRIGPAGATNLTGTAYGSDRLGACDTLGTGCVAAITRTSADTGTLWVATGTGRVFISKNANDPTPANVTYKRLDNLPSATADPGRFITGITIDPANTNHAWISYSGYTFNTPSQPGHVFEVTYDPSANAGAGDATWTLIDGSGATAFPDFPATAIARDSNGDLYVANDWGVLRNVGGNPANGWVVAGSGLPMVECAGLTIVPSARKLYVATHGRSAWQLTLP